MLYMSVDEESIELCDEDREHLAAEAGKEQALLCSMVKTDDYLRDLDRLKEEALKQLWMSTAS